MSIYRTNELNIYDIDCVKNGTLPLKNADQGALTSPTEQAGAETGTGLHFRR